VPQRAKGCCGPPVPAHGALSEAATKDRMNINLGLTPLISLLAGILILVMPRLLNFIVAIYLILIGLVGIFGLGSLKLS
jgi:hypothetical protein